MRKLVRSPSMSATALSRWVMSSTTRAFLTGRWSVVSILLKREFAAYACTGLDPEQVRDFTRCTAGRIEAALDQTRHAGDIDRQDRRATRSIFRADDEDRRQDALPLRRDAGHRQRPRARL